MNQQLQQRDGALAAAASFQATSDVTSAHDDLVLTLSVKDVDPVPPDNDLGCEGAGREFHGDREAWGGGRRATSHLMGT